MRIAQVEINNFRGIQAAKVYFPKQCVVFGPNNVGKTAITDALVLALGREQMAPAISDWDFYGGNPKPDSRIDIIATITDFGDSDKPEDFPDWFRGERSARPVWWSEDSRLLSTEADCPTGHKLAAQIALSIRYDDETCEFEPIRYFYDGPCNPFLDEHRKVPNARLQELGVFLLPGNRQWDRLLTFGSSSFLKMLKASGAIPGISIENLKSELRSPQNKIEDDPKLKAILESAQRELNTFRMLKDSKSRISANSA